MIVFRMGEFSVAIAQKAQVVFHVSGGGEKGRGYLFLRCDLCGYGRAGVTSGIAVLVGEFSGGVGVEPLDQCHI